MTSSAENLTRIIHKATMIIRTGRAPLLLLDVVAIIKGRLLGHGGTGKRNL
jgi:hypothetical protein